MTYVLGINTKHNLDLTATLPLELTAVLGRCLRSEARADSQELAAIWITAGIESVLFPSATGSGRNVVVYLQNTGSESVAVRNRAEVLAALRRA